jgi:hypothetical protein
MNLIGKIFVVLIFVMSLVFMSFAIAVYSVHKNWRDAVVNEDVKPDKPKGYYPQLKDEKTRYEALNLKFENLTKDRDKAKTDQEQALSKLQSKLETEMQERKRLEAGYAALEKAKSDQVAAMSATQGMATTYRTELDKLRSQISEAQKDRDAIFKDLVQKTDEFNQAVSDKEQLRKRTEDLAKDLAKAKEALRWNNIDENTDYKSKAPPKVDGIVTEVRGDGYIVVSLGSDAGIRVGHTLQVFRISGGANAYVGRVEVVKTAADKSVCKIDPKYQNTNMMQGDRVASKIE